MTRRNAKGTNPWSGRAGPPSGERILRLPGCRVELESAEWRVVWGSDSNPDCFSIPIRQLQERALNRDLREATCSRVTADVEAAVDRISAADRRPAGRSRPALDHPVGGREGVDREGEA